MNLKRIANIVFREFPIYYISRIFDIFPNHGITCALRGRFVKEFFGSCGRNFKIAQYSIINYPEKMNIGNNVYFAHRIYVNAVCGLHIENNVTIGPNCIIATANHTVKNGAVLDKGSGGTVTIKEGTWIGGNTTITAGVTIGAGCTIGAGSVVTKNIPDNVLAAGVPARILRHTNDGGEDGSGFCTRSPFSVV